MNGPSLADFRLLGIEETADPAEIKKAYRRRVKQLHPDTGEGGSPEAILKNHFLFAGVCAAYRRLMASFAPRPGSARVGASDAAAGANGPQGAKGPAGAIGAAGGSLKPHADPAWVYYRKGCEYFSRIHPSAWNPTWLIETDAKTPGDLEAQRETADRVRNLVSLFPKAYLYFSTVANEYPDSPWVEDSREKMRLIEDRVKRYRKIIESFASWGGHSDREREGYEEMMRENKRRYEAFPADERRRWGKK